MYTLLLQITLLFTATPSGIDTCVIGRTDFTRECLKGVDVVFSAGGDGTFLLGASKILNKNLPLIGVNTDPER